MMTSPGHAKGHGSKKNLGLMLLLSSAFMWIIFPQHAYGAIPQQPSTFKNNWDEVENPLLLWTFRQTECLSGTIKEDRGVGPDLVRQSDSACPSNGTFTNAVVGATSTSTTARNTIKSGAVGTTLSSITTPNNTAPFRAMSIVLWLTPTGENLVDGNKYMLLEIGQENGNTPAFDVGDNQLQIFIQAFAGANNDRLFAQVLLNTHEDAAFPTLRSCVLGNVIEPMRSAAGVRHFLALTLAYDGANLVIGSYLGAAGGTLETCIGVQGVSQSFSGEQPKSFGFQPDSVIRVGSSRTSGNGGFGFPATYHLVGIYDRGLSAVEVNKLFVAGLPNSLPVVRTSDIVANENSQSNIINLNQSTIRFDYDGNPVKSFRIRSLPASTDGDLYYEGNLITTTDFPVADVSQFTFRQAAAKVNNFSIASGSTCTTPFATFNYVASDGLCDSPSTPPSAANCNSPVNATAKICVVDVADPPQSQNSLGHRVRTGSSLNFTLVPFDNDDFRSGLSDLQVSLFRMRELNGIFADNARIEFNKTIGSFGNLTLWTGACTSTALAAGTPLIFATVSAVRSFTFCFVSDPTKGGASAEDIGHDMFGFRFIDSGNTPGPWYVANFTVTNPLETCPSSPGIPISSLPGLDGSVCRSIGEESQFNDTKLIPVYLQARDFIGNRPMTFQVTSLPAHGKLFLNANPTGTPQKGAQVTLATDIPPIDATEANLLFQPDNEYFNIINRPSGARADQPFANHADLGFDGCVAQSTSCRCSTSVAPGCPDSFRYKAFAGSAISVNGTYELHVLSRVSNFTVTAPTQLVLNSSIDFAETNLIRVNDPDDDAYMIGVILNPFPGAFGIRPNPGLSALTFFPPETADCITATCSTPVKFFGSPSSVNRALSNMFFTAQSWRNGTSIVMVFGKPSPHGALAGIDDSAINNATLRSRFEIVVLTAAAPATSPNNGLEIAIIAGASAAGFLALVCFINACVWFIRRSRRAAKAARKSLASHKSKRQSQLAALEDEERQSSNSDSRGGCLVWCFGKSKADPDRAALAEHRQSAVSQKSHHSTRSAGGQKLFQEDGVGPQRDVVSPSVDGQDVQVADDSVFAWEKHIDRRTGDVYYFNPQTGVSQCDPPTIKVKRNGK